MGIGAAIFLIAVGAILKFAVKTTISGIDLGVVGVVLIIVGIIGLLFTAFIWGPRRRAVVRDERVVNDGYGRDSVRMRDGDTVVREREYYDGP